MKERQGHTQHRLKSFLYPPHPGAWRVRILLEELLLSEGEDRHKRSPGGAGRDPPAADWADWGLKVPGATFLLSNRVPVDIPCRHPPTPHPCSSDNLMNLF